MNKLYRYFTLSMVALVGLSLAGCSEDNLDTNPYNKSGVNLVAFGPSPVLRTHEIRITGTNLTQVTSVAFPGEGAVVEKSAFNKVDDRDLYLNVPDASVPGQIKLMVGSEAVATSVSPITFEEPIEIESVSPTTGLNAGDEVTVKGEYVYKVLSATYAGLSVKAADFGQEVQISGTNLHTVETVMFPGGVTSEFTVSDDHKTLTTNIPAETKSGAITLVLYSGASLTTDEVTLPTLAVTKVSPDKDLRAGDKVTVTGENFDRIAG